MKATTRWPVLGPLVSCLAQTRVTSVAQAAASPVVPPKESAIEFSPR
ncbi:MAG: hypothetical protein ABIY47_11305 [Opitutaceae bacterium]